MLYAVCEADGPDALVVWWTLDLAHSVLRMLLMRCFIHRPGNYLVDWLADTEGLPTLVSMGPMHIVTTASMVGLSGTLTEDNVALLRGRGAVFGVFQMPDHFYTVIDTGNSPYRGVIPVAISKDDARNFGDRINTSTRSSPNPAAHVGMLTQLNPISRTRSPEYM